MSFGFGFGFPKNYVAATFDPRTLFGSGEQGAWYDPSDLSTLYQDSAGTTPVTAVEQPVGLMLDKSKGLVLGPELVTNGGFDSTAGWTTDFGWVISGGKAVATNASGGYSLYQAASVSPKKLYRVTFTISNYVSGGVFASLFNNDNGVIYSANGTYTEFILAKNTLGQLGLAAASGGFTGSIDNISVRELPGNHAYQTTSVNRPVLSARYNLLTKTEQFDDAAWGKQAISATAAQAPDGTQTAFKLVPSVQEDTHVIFQANITTSATCIIRFQAKADGYSTLAVREFPNATNGAAFDFSAGTVTNTGTGVGTITPVDDGWYSCTVTVVLTGVLFYVPYSSSTFVGDGVSGVRIWRPEVLVLNQSSLPYQRVNTATDYDTAGFPLYLKFDGIDDAMQTNSIDFTATDKMTVFAGVRKLSDAATATFAELSSSIDLNNGAFLVTAPALSGDDKYVFESKGTVKARANTTSVGLSAPITNVITGVGDISGDSAILRVNGTQAATSGVDQVTGNYGNYPLYIGAREGTDLFFNGHLYNLIVRGAQSTEQQIIDAERYINEKTRAY